MQPKLVQMAETYATDTGRLKEKVQTLERLLAEHEKHSMQLRDRLIKAGVKCLQHIAHLVSTIAPFGNI